MDEELQQAFEEFCAKLKAIESQPNLPTLTNDEEHA